MSKIIIFDIPSVGSLCIIMPLARHDQFFSLNNTKILYMKYYQQKESIITFREPVRIVLFPETNLYKSLSHSVIMLPLPEYTT